MIPCTPRPRWLGNSDVSAPICSVDHYLNRKMSGFPIHQTLYVHTPTCTFILLRLWHERVVLFIAHLMGGMISTIIIFLFVFYITWKLIGWHKILRFVRLAALLRRNLVAGAFRFDCHCARIAGSFCWVSLSASGLKSQPPWPSNCNMCVWNFLKQNNKNANQNEFGRVSKKYRRKSWNWNGRAYHRVGRCVIVNRVIPAHFAAS